MSKQGRGPRSKPAVVLGALHELKEEFAAHGVALTELGISCDSWWIGEGFGQELEALGFVKQVICGKSHLVLETEQSRQSLKDHYRELEAGWGHEELPARRVRGRSPTLGEVAVVFFARPRTKAYALLCPQRALRTCEALRLWASYHAVGVFWKRLKGWLGLGKMQLPGRDGAWALAGVAGIGVPDGAIVVGPCIDAGATEACVAPARDVCGVGPGAFSSQGLGNCLISWHFL